MKMTKRGFIVEQMELIGRAVYPEYRRWLRRTAGERRCAIFARVCLENAPARSMVEARAGMGSGIRCLSLCPPARE